MTVASPGGSPVMPPFPRSLSLIVVSGGGLALFITFASWVLVSNPIGSSVSGYLYDYSDKDYHAAVDLRILNEKGGDFPVMDRRLNKENLAGAGSVSETEEELMDRSAHGYGVSSNMTKENEVDGSSVSSNITAGVKIGDDLPSGPSNDSVHSGCDLYSGSWFYDPAGPSYTNNTCPVITQTQNCQGNGRPDREYENWRWKPSQCDLPRFDGREFLELMRGKTLAFVGDSVARNQMESLMCLLWQVEVPKNRGNRKMQRWQFKSTSTMIIRIWSSWLVHRTSEEFAYAPEGIDKLHLDLPDENYIKLISTFDVLVLSSGHWFVKQSVYILNDEIVGSQLWFPPNRAPPSNVSNVEAFAISFETILTSLATNYTGLTVVRSFSPDHYEGGSCTGKVRPLGHGETAGDGFASVMREKQVTGFGRAVKKARNGSKLRLMDVTEAFGYRHDGHPGPYRRVDPDKATRRGPPPEDCLHWCMPGPVDTWNELLLEIMRREL